VTISNYQQKQLRKGQKMSNYIVIWHDGVKVRAKSKSSWRTEDMPIHWIENKKVLSGLVAWYQVLDRQTGQLVYHAELNEIA
jgi:hypothetical protein